MSKIIWKSCGHFMNDDKPSQFFPKLYVLGAGKLFFHQYFHHARKYKVKHIHKKFSLQLYVLWLFFLETVFLMVSF